MLWLYDNHREFLEPNLHLKMVELNELDEHKHTAEMNKNTRRVKKRHVPNTRPNLRKYFKSCIENTPPGDCESQRHSSPVKIDGDGAINHAIVKEFMQVGMNEVWVDRDAAEAYIKDARLGSAVTDEMVNNDGKVKCMVYQSASQYSGIRSAIAYLYKLARVPVPEDMTREIAMFLSGMERTISSAKQKLGLKISEGKKPMSYRAYSLLAKRLFQSRAKEDVFTHLFLVLDWCLMKRAENCVTAKINHIRFGDDCLVFEFAKSKGNQRGEDHRGPWHVYSNPSKPWLCPMLALSLYLLLNPDILKGDAPLFQGKEKTVFTRYSDNFNKLKEEMKDELEALGFSPRDLGTHSARKGVATMVAAGCTVSPPIVSLCIRAGWVLGGVKDKYLFRENAGDQYVGRCASCLDQTKKEFAVSPAYFDYSMFDAEERIKQKKMVQNFVDSRLGYAEGTVTNTARQLIMMCFAAVCYEYKKLQDTYLDINSCVRIASLFRDIPDEIVALAVVRYPWNQTSDTPRPTGIPPHVLHLVEMENLRNDVKNLKSDLLTSITAEMDARGFRSKEHSTERILELIRTVTKQQTEAIVNRLQESSTLAAISAKEASARTASEYSDFVMVEEDDMMDDLPKNATQDEVQLSQHKTLQNSASSLANRKYRVGLVNVMFRGRRTCKFRVLPPNYKFPTMTPPQLIENWFIGDVRANIPPFSSLTAESVRHIKHGATVIRCMKRFMSFVETLGRANACWGDRKASSPIGWDLSAVKALWEGIQKDFKDKYLHKKQRKREIAWTTVYRKMRMPALAETGDSLMPDSSGDPLPEGTDCGI